jgi:hypothetical protein
VNQKIRRQTLDAGVAKHGQRRSPEAAIPQGFVGSNPTSRTISEHPANDEILTKYLSHLLCKKSVKLATIKRKVKMKLRDKQWAMHLLKMRLSQFDEEGKKRILEWYGLSAEDLDKFGT